MEWRLNFPPNHWQLMSSTSPIQLRVAAFHGEHLEIAFPLGGVTMKGRHTSAGRNNLQNTQGSLPLEAMEVRHRLALKAAPSQDNH